VKWPFKFLDLDKNDSSTDCHSRGTTQLQEIYTLSNAQLKESKYSEGCGSAMYLALVHVAFANWSKSTASGERATAIVDASDIETESSSAGIFSQ